MAEDTAPAAPEATTEPAPAESTFTQAQVNDLIAKEKGKIQGKYGDYGELKAKAAKLTEIEEASASELEKAQKKAAEAEKQLATTQAGLLRHEVATEKGVPGNLLPLLTATDKEGLEAQANLILENAKPATPSFDGGTREPTPEPKSADQSHNDTILAMLGRPIQ